MSKLYVGIDVGKDEVMVAVPGRAPKGFPHTAAGVRSLVAWIRKGMPDSTQLHVCLEATGIYSRHLALLLMTHAHLEVSIINPAQIAAFARAQLRRTKTDRVDAAVIQRFAESQQPRVWSPEPIRLQQLHALVAERDTVLRLLIQLTNRDHSFTYHAGLPREVITAQKALIRACRRQLAALEAAITRFCAEDPLVAHDLALLDTIPGIAPQTAVHLLAYGGGALVSHSPKELTAHAGLAPSHHQSGTRQPRSGSLAKQGNARLRTALYLAAVAATRPISALHPVYRRLRANGKPPKVALIACMRKLLLIAQAVLKTKKPFNPALSHLT